MEIYNTIGLFFAIGFVGIIAVWNKQKQNFEVKKQWTKFAVYFALVYGQLFLIETNGYIYFSYLIFAIGFYEVFLIRKSFEKFYFGAIIYLGLAGFYILFFKETEIRLQQFLFLLVITFDGYSQVFGQLFGKIKLFPKTSPNKTFEGLFGGFCFTILTSVLISKSLYIYWLNAILYSCFICVFSFFGDILASYYKRLNSVKDFSNLIPAHGGILDRFDSLLFASFGFYFLLKLDFSNQNLIAILSYSFCFLILFLISELLFHSLKCKVEISRKWMHFSSGICCLTIPFFISNHWIVLFLTSSFALILMISKKYNFLKSINSIDRKSFGSVLFPVTIYLSFVSYQYLNQGIVFYYLPILILAICDPIAALLGKKWPLGKYKIGSNYKTLIGSIGFFCSCFVVVLISLYLIKTENSIMELLLLSFIISIFTTFTEAICQNGTDNVFIPICVFACLLVLS